MRANRLYIAVLFASVAVLAVVYAAFREKCSEMAETVLVLGFCSTLFSLGFLAWRGAGRAGIRAWERELDRLRKQNLLRQDTYFVTRAFRLAEQDAEGPCYFLELKDRRVLCLFGQYLYAENERGNFPSDEITVLRHAERGDVLDLICGEQRVPLSADLPVGNKDGRWKDGEITAVSFDALLAEYKNTAEN